MMAAQEGPKNSVGCSFAPPLPLEVFALITSALSMQDKFILMRVCGQWRAHLQSPICWQDILVANGEQANGINRKVMPLSALRKVLEPTDNSVQRVQLARLTSQDIILAIQELVKTNSERLSVLHVYPDPSYLMDEQNRVIAGAVGPYIRSLEEARPVARRDQHILALLFDTTTLHGLTIGPCTNLREFLISHCGPEIGLWRAVLPACLKTLMIQGPDVENKHTSGLWYNLQMKTSLTKLIMRHDGRDKATVFFNQIQAASPGLQSLSLRGFETGSQLDSFEAQPGGRIIHPKGVHVLQHLREFIMHDCLYELPGPLPPQLRILRITSCELDEQSLYDWRTSACKQLEELQFTQVCNPEDMDYYDSAEWVRRLVESFMVGETDLHWNPDVDWTIEDRKNVSLRSLWIAAGPDQPDEYEPSLDSALPYVLQHYGHNLTRLQVTGPWLCDYVHGEILSTILLMCRQLESLTFDRILNLGTLSSRLADIEEFISEIDEGWGLHRKKKSRLTPLPQVKLRELRLWGCPAESSEIEALKSECTTRGIRFEWLPRDCDPDGQWQAPVYNWKAAERSLFDTSQREVADEEYNDHPPISGASHAEDPSMAGVANQSPQEWWAASS